MRALLQQAMDQPPLTLQIEAAVIVEGRQQNRNYAFELALTHYATHNTGCRMK
jgi:hypothetical protein